MGPTTREANKNPFQQNLIQQILSSISFLFKYVWLYTRKRLLRGVMRWNTWQDSMHSHMSLVRQISLSLNCARVFLHFRTWSQVNHYPLQLLQFCFYITTSISILLLLLDRSESCIQALLGLASNNSLFMDSSRRVPFYRI